MRAFYLRPHYAGLLLPLAALLPLLAQTAVAVPINYGDFSGTTVDYLDVTEDSSTGDTLPLFGAPNISGDSLDFDPVGFSANSAGGGAPDQTTGQLAFMIRAKAGKAIESLSLSEAGDTSLARSIVSSDDASTSVTAIVSVQILDVDFLPLTTAISTGGMMTFTPSAGDYLLSTDGAGNPTYNTSWTGSFFLELGPILAANSITGLATKVSISVDNALTATSALNSSALIAKKDFDGVVITVNPGPDNVVPEPTSCVLAALGLLTTLGCCRRGR
ncbi:hypothetical protein Pla175_31200 [Pirellulimonas nuda]|uniref:PEP-CTERM protein-sorting domain-containing protein n=1 Tax=Pirellulimonas nuda TaxID=2528009 RepID=A0A518DE14_9BACT|nr:hypothetical protein [Pirellulimonas nuda]QDU89725.1 hypothetical protein Pla175_31200 [Pirellulimonas nuda]